MAFLGILDIASVNPLENFCILSVEVPTEIISALGFLLLHGTYSVRYMLDDTESTKPVMCFGIVRGLIMFLVVLQALLTML